MAPMPTPSVKMSYPCSDCSFEAQSARQLSRHRAVTHVENALKCVLCPFVTAYQTNLLRHRREVHGICGSKGNKSCKFCGFLSEDNETLIRHQLEVHRDILKSAQVKFAKELVSAGGEETPNSLTANAFSKFDLKLENESKPSNVKQETQIAINASDANQEDDEDDDKNFWKEGFIDDGPNLYMNLATLQQSREKNDVSNWYTSSGQTSPQSHENSISDFSFSRSNTPMVSFKQMPLPTSGSTDDLPATRIRRQYTCNDCGFRTINPREFLYHRRDAHGQRLKIVECPYCVYACQYVQKLQRHLLLVHKLETSMTPPPEMAQQSSKSDSSLPSKSNKSKASLSPKQSTQSSPSKGGQLAITSGISGQLAKPEKQNFVPKIKVKLPTATSPAVAISEVRVSSPSKVRNVRLTAKPVAGAKKKIAMRQLSHNQKRAVNDKSLFNIKYHKCQTCGYMTNVHYLFKKHMKYHSAPKIKCEMCDFESPYSWNVDRHVRSHFSNGLFKCTKCSFACDKKQALTVHMTQHHRDRGNAEEPQQQQQQPIPELVPILQPNIEEDNEEIDNLETDNAINDEPEKTEENIYANIQAIQEKQNQSVDNLNRSPTTYMRQIDGKIVAKQGVLKKCKYCQFQTDTFAKLQKHETSYHPEKKFQCPLCEIKFENLVWLQRHLTHMHQEDSQANNIISILDQLNPKRKRNKPLPPSAQQQTQALVDNAVKQSLVNPIKKKQSVSDKTSTQCQVCGYQTRWISELEKHMRVHTKERPFACPYCSFKSKWKGDLNRHIQKYHSRLPMPDLNAMEQQIQLQSNISQLSTENVNFSFAQTQDISQEDYINENCDNDMALVPVEEDYNEDDYDDNIEEIKMDENLLPDDYEERPLVFDDMSDNDGGDDADNDDNENELQIDFEERDLVIANDMPNTSESPSEMTKSGKVKMYRCSYCDFTCSTASRFHVHFVQHLNTKPFQCSVCGHRSNWEWDVTKHIKMKSQRDSKHIDAKAMLVHESGKRDYSKYNKYVLWVEQKEAIANNSNNSKIDFRAKRARLEHNDNDYDDGDNAAADGEYEEDGNYNSADPESIVITPDISYAVPGDDDDSSNAAGIIDVSQVSALQPNVPYNSSTAAHEEKLLQCYYCDFKHKESKVMISHLSTHAGMKPYRCRLCGFDSNWREVVVRHCASRHGTTVEDVEQRFKCTVTKSMCKIVDENGSQKPVSNSHLPSAVQAFQESHQSVRISGFKGSFTCSLCPFRAEKAFHMDFHVKRHQPSSGPFKCPHCPYWVNAKKSLVKHMLLHANKPEENHEYNANHLELTGVNYDDDESENELVIYEGDDTNNNANYYNQQNNFTSAPIRQSASVSKNKCDSCPFVAGTKTQLLYHKQFHRPNRNATYKCPMCSYSVSYLHLLNQHMKVHLQNSGEIQTTVNSAEFNQEVMMDNDNDERDESDIPFTMVQIGNIKRRLFQCRFCPTTSKRRTYIYVHEKMHTQNTNENFKCSHCAFSTRDATAFLEHFNTHNKSNDSKDEEQPKSDVEHVTESLRLLSQSSLSSPSVSVIDVNNIRHGNRRMFSYVCPDCPAAFKSPGDLKIHSAFHDANHPHPCPYCNYRAKNKPQLCKHLYVHTAEYIAKRANSYPDGTKLLIGDAVDHMKRDLRSPLKESASDENEKRDNAFSLHSITNPISLLKPSPELHLSKKLETTNSEASPPWSAIAKEINPDKLHKRPSLVSSGARTPREQMIILEMTETKGYLEKIKTGGKHRYIYRCSHCPAVFMKVNTLTFHVGMHGSECQFRCDNCSYSSTSNDNLYAHQQLHHVKPFMFSSQSVYNHRCDRCPAAFSKRSRLEKHLSLHGLDAKWKCDKCDYAVHYAATLVKHRACHVLNPNFNSGLAINEDNQTDDMENLDTSHINSTENVFKMPQIPVTPQSAQTSSNNIEKNEEKLLFCCDRCPYVHNRRDAVQSHQKRHESQLRNIRDGKQCPYCDYTCLQPSYLRDHILWHFDPVHDRRPIAYTNFNEIEIWNSAEEEEIKEFNVDQSKILLFRDRGSSFDIRQRFEPLEDDKEFFEIYDSAGDLTLECEADDYEDEEPIANNNSLPITENSFNENIEVEEQELINSANLE